MCTHRSHTVTPPRVLESTAHNTLFIRDRLLFRSRSASFPHGCLKCYINHKRELPYGYPLFFFLSVPPFVSSTCQSCWICIHHRPVRGNPPHTFFCDCNGHLALKHSLSRTPAPSIPFLSLFLFISLSVSPTLLAMFLCSYYSGAFWQLLHSPVCKALCL